jgi:hypothetical protein
MLKGIAMNEIKLSRVLTKLNDDNHVISMITAFRWSNTDEVNVADNKKIAAECRENFAGFVFIDGYWIEDDSEATEPKPEVSLFIDVSPERENELFEWSISTAKRYNQDAFLFKGINHPIGFYGKDGVLDKTNPLNGKVTPDKIAQAYSRLKFGPNKGRSFILEDARHQKFDGFFHASLNTNWGF